MQRNDFSRLIGFPLLPSVYGRFRDWLNDVLIDLVRQMRLSYVPPMMVYFAAGLSGITGIVGTFFVKDFLGLSAEFLASLGFWAMMPWTLKMPIGHMVDLLWRHKAKLIFFGAALIAVSVLIMLNILADPKSMSGLLPVDNWFVIATLLAPIGYVIQDTVADAMTVEAVPRTDPLGKPLPAEQIQLAHTTMQTLGRVAIIGGTLIVALANMYWFRDVEQKEAAQQISVYLTIYRWSLCIPLVSVFGVILAAYLRSKEEWRLASKGFEFPEIARLLDIPSAGKTQINWPILGGGLCFAFFATLMGLSNISFSEEIIFTGSLVIVIFLMRRLTESMLPDHRRELFGTALVIFAFRAVPSSGVGATWWMIDVLGFDQQFLSKLSLISSGLTLLGMFIFRRFIAEKSITEIILILTLALTLLSIPEIALYYGFHHWTQSHIAGFIDARFIAIVDTALGAPLGQIAMIPMLAWIANSAPAGLKATYFAVMAGLVNLALSLSQLITKYLNQWFLVTREVKNAATGEITIPADYSQLGGLFFAGLLLSLVMPILAVLFAKRSLIKSGDGL